MSNTQRRIEKMSLSDGLKMVFVALLWALCFPLIKVGVAGGTSPLLFGALRTAIASLTLFGVAIRRKEVVSETSKHKVLLLAIGLMAFFGYFGMVLGGSSVNPGLASVVSNTNPLIASVLAAIFLSESLNLRKVVGLLLGFLGVIFISVPAFTGDISNSLAGIGLVLVGSFGAAAGNVLLKKIANSSFPISVLAIQFVCASGLLFLAALLIEGPLSLKWNLGFSISLVTLSIGGTALADIIWLDLLKRNSLTKLNVFIFLTPAFSLVMGMMFFNEKVGVWELFGMVAILAGVFLILERRSSEDRNRPMKDSPLALPSISSSIKS
jgi:drug/metabolite transporter (DMT)-like permease